MGEEDRMKNRKEKERKKSWDQVFKQKEVLCWDWTQCIGIYICILVTSTTTGHDGSVVPALASQAKGRGSIPTYGRSFFSHKYFLSSLSNLRWESNWTDDPSIWSDFVQWCHAHLINAPMVLGLVGIGYARALWFEKSGPAMAGVAGPSDTPMICVCIK